MRDLRIGILVLVLAWPVTAEAKARGASFEECQARAVALGIPPSRTTRVHRDYLRYKAAGTAINPKGVVARCMAGRS